MLIIRQALICDVLSHLSFAVVTRITCYGSKIPQLICWQPSPGAWNVNKTQNESHVHCGS
ncbi:hypothetical protein N305_09241, partial [Manacus vitellinus]